ncbi:MAG: hypothetical protein ABIH41_05470 [Nanoarchaeota archaeon]
MDFLGYAFRPFPDEDTVVRELVRAGLQQHLTVVAGSATVVAGLNSPGYVEVRYSYGKESYGKEKVLCEFGTDDGFDVVFVRGEKWWEARLLAEEVMHPADVAEVFHFSSLARALMGRYEVNVHFGHQQFVAKPIKVARADLRALVIPLDNHAELARFIYALQGNTDKPLHSMEFKDLAHHRLLEPFEI